jgi:hypothetical protein
MKILTYHFKIRNISSKTKHRQMKVSRDGYVDKRQRNGVHQLLIMTFNT